MAIKNAYTGVEHLCGDGRIEARIRSAWSENEKEREEQYGVDIIAIQYAARIEDGTK